MMTRWALVVLGLVIGFVITWALGETTLPNLAAGIPLFIAGAVIGFIAEWFMDESYRKNRDLQRLLREREVALAAPVIQVAASDRLSLPEQSASAPTQHPLGVEGGHETGAEALASFLRQRDEDLREVRQQLAATTAQIDSLRIEFETYQRTHPDNLTAIKGIGPVYQWKLRDAGFNTFKQLATANPDQLRRMLDVKKWQRVNFESWIEQARDWAQRGS
jgi:predicted flap endonuclease-1-like 5' DNA nuclease